MTILVALLLWVGALQLITVTEHELVRAEGRVVWMEIDQCKKPLSYVLVTNWTQADDFPNLWQGKQQYIHQAKDERIQYNFKEIGRRLGHTINLRDGWTVQPQNGCRVKLWIETPEVEKRP